MLPLSADVPKAPSVPDYELFQRIGAGAYGEVWLARNLATRALRAVKIVYRSTFTDERPFNREFEGIKKFDTVSRSHPSQLALFHVGRNDASGYFYYVMELADAISAVGPYRAHTLRADHDHGHLSAARVLEIGLALTEALAHLHSNGLIHRDVKPSNIIFVGGRPKLADIGLVTDASDSRSIVGTEGYLPREGPGTPAADIFALGKVLYEALTGLDRRQFPNLPTELREWPDAALVFEINEIVLKACAADARDRYPSAALMLADLKLLDAGKSVKRRQSIKRAWSSGWKAAVVICVLAFAVVTLINQREGRALLNRQNAAPWEAAGTTNREAWQTVQRAFSMGGAYTPIGLSNAVQEFERAVLLDPNYSEGWCGLAMTLVLEARYEYVSASNTLARAKICAEKAIALNSMNGFAYSALAECALPLDYDFTNTERLYRKAIELEPGNGAARLNFAFLLVCYDRFAEAKALADQITKEEPANSGSYDINGFLLAASVHFREAISSFDEAGRLSRGQPSHYSHRADVYFALDDRSAAARDLLGFVEHEGFPALNAQTDGATLRHVLEERGADEFLRQEIGLLEDRVNHGMFVPSYELAKLYVYAGNKTRALDYLEQAVDEHSTFTLSAKVHIAFKDLQDEPRYHVVLRRMKLEK